MLKLENVSLCRSRNFTLLVERLEVGVGETITLLGASGSGKSTLIRLIAGLETHEQGDISFKGRVVTDDPPHQRQMSLLAQDFGLWPHLSAVEHIAFARSRGSNLKAIREDFELLELVHLGHKAEAMPGLLSGGERQRLALARALARRPRLLLLDEPFSNVDPVLAAELAHLLEEIHEPWGLTRIQVRHWMTGRPPATERYVVMEAGRLVQDGSWHMLACSPATEWIRQYVSLAA